MTDYDSYCSGFDNGYCSGYDKGLEDRLEQVIKFILKEDMVYYDDPVLLANHIKEAITTQETP